MTNTEINEAVARKLGYERRSRLYYPTSKPEEYWWHCEKPNRSLDNKWTEDIEAAWEVFEKLPLNCGVCRLSKGYVVVFNKDGKFGEISVADTAPLAISLAFLELP